MTRLFHPLLFLLARSNEDELQRQVEFLKAENELLRRRVPKQRVFLKPGERARLLKLGRPLGPSIRQLITIVDYSTFRRWVRKEEGGVTPNSGAGRPRVAAIIRELIVKLAKETGWGYSRILGELRKLGVGRVSRQTVKNLLRENGLDPGPKRGKGSWGEFLKIHADTLWQVDFFSKQIWTLKGPRQVFAIAFVHVATRKVFVTPATRRPHAAWMERQAGAFLEHCRQEQLGYATIMRDLDGKYGSGFDRFFTERGIKMKPVGPRAPNLNAFVERWIQSLKHEALNYFEVFGLEHFDLIVREFVDHYHDERPHQGLGNRRIGEEEDHQQPAVVGLDEVRCKERLGGLLKHYYREAA